MQYTGLKFRFAALGLGLVLACGGGRDSQFLAVDPDPPTVMVGETLRLGAQPQVSLSGDVEWDVQENYGGGLLRSQGLSVTYIPPEAAGTYHLVANSTINGRPCKQIVEVQVVANPTLEPAAPRIQPGSTVQFRVRMRGLARDTATWTVEEGGVELTQDGRFTAPPRHGVYHVAATSTLDPSVSVRATVTVADN